jgi:hypothetical protein
MELKATPFTDEEVSLLFKLYFEGYIFSEIVSHFNHPTRKSSAK